MGKINKIIELLIDWDNLEDDDLGVDIMSLVETPAIGVSWQVFAAQQFVEVLPGESKDDYITRCVPALIDEGYESDQASAICYGSFKEVDGLTEEDAIALINRPDFGERLNFENTIYLDLSKQNFDNQSDFLQGVRALDILGLMDATQEPEIKWRYNGPFSTRPFCAAMLAPSVVGKILRRANQSSTNMCPCVAAPLAPTIPVSYTHLTLPTILLV